MIDVMTIGQLAKRSGLSERTPPFYTDSGVLPEVGRTDSGYAAWEWYARAQRSHAAPARN
jgi:hypothetical protein